MKISIIGATGDMGYGLALRLIMAGHDVCIGSRQAEKAQEAAKALFVGGGDMSNVPATQLSQEDLAGGSIGILDLMMKCKLAPSKKEARRLVEQGGVEVDGEKVTDVAASYTADQMAGDGLMLKKGKKVFHRVRM